jgi:SAM-dependent methyltransferase
VTTQVERPSASLSFGAAMAGVPCTVHGLADAPHPLPMHRWAGLADASDEAVLALCRGPVLDVGCGPGRMSGHLAARGVEVLGLDVVPEAVAATRSRGASAMRGDVFDALPGHGSWACVLLADGNIGIGGDPVRLLRRVRRLLAADGRVVVDLALPGSGQLRHVLELECGGLRSAPFPWTVLGPECLPGVAGAAGLRVDAVHDHDGRWFAVLVAAGSRD